MTDAEFMLSHVKQERSMLAMLQSADDPIGVSQELREMDRKQAAQLDALEALAKIPCHCKRPDVTQWSADSATDFTMICKRCEALRKFREAMEGT